jgi:hypothetical protein
MRAYPGYRVLRSFFLDARDFGAAKFQPQIRTICASCQRTRRRRWNKYSSPRVGGPVASRNAISRASRSLATVTDGMPLKAWKDEDSSSFAVPKEPGPLEVYDERVATGRLRDDEHQRGMLQLTVPGIALSPPPQQASYRIYNICTTCSRNTRRQKSFARAYTLSNLLIHFSGGYSGEERSGNSRPPSQPTSPRAYTCTETLGVERPC